MMTEFEDIDLGLEKLVFLLNAEEGNPGIYELIYELGYYNLTIEDKYKIARILLIDLISEGLVVLQKYKDHSFNEKIGTVEKEHIHGILNNPSSWYPCSNEILAINLTDEGNHYLDKEMPKYADRITHRFSGKNRQL